MNSVQFLARALPRVTPKQSLLLSTTLLNVFQPPNSIPLKEVNPNAPFTSPRNPYSLSNSLRIPNRNSVNSMKSIFYLLETIIPIPSALGILSTDILTINDLVPGLENYGLREKKVDVETE